ncbi:hypothetical protein [Hyphomicrobium sp.]|uniref:hypothetical protein n=1 Tax=Hyphomicrobium sp. TaxID=82 RepID=UPI001D592EE7|nr:hypothetical protein [Hyphomicrobium sp.]MBY0560998.1 hypothetical protein [Hyphomicrobium sp.]
MRVNWSDVIAGVTMLEIRDFLRYVNRTSFCHLLLVKHLNVTEGAAITIVEKLLGQGLIRVDPTVQLLSEPAFALTPTGDQFAYTKAVARIGKPKADAILRKFRERIESVNSDRKLAFYVKRAFLFGSYIDPGMTDYGDLDIAIDLQSRIVWGAKFFDYCEERVEKAGKGNLRRAQAVRYCKREVERLLINRSHYISLADMSVIEPLKIRLEEFYVAHNKEPCESR